ncbi:hypothetical protein TrCOL_g3321 [Triparma columacea]|uniref:N-acetyltransferase domain-containing protein n=1 Tax=Triparma columacea TaxID=722753 RepID=A0A9W7GJ70_9STRA|nr:hypothetical protein TrCOL_g3321 [Triparma columacea]
MGRWEKEEDDKGYKGRQFVAEINGEIVGWCEIRMSKFGIGVEQLSEFALSRNTSLSEVPLITNLCVEEEVRGKGVGKKLVEAAIKAGSGWGKEVYLQVESTNVKAIDFYRKLHFDVVFDDPACRRVDVGWLGWEEKRTVKTCMRRRVRWF